MCCFMFKYIQNVLLRIINLNFQLFSLKFILLLFLRHCPSSTLINTQFYLFLLFSFQILFNFNPLEIHWTYVVISVSELVQISHIIVSFKQYLFVISPLVYTYETLNDYVHKDLFLYYSGQLIYQAINMLVHKFKHYQFIHS